MRSRTYPPLSFYPHKLQRLCILIHLFNFLHCTTFSYTHLSLFPQSTKQFGNPTLCFPQPPNSLFSLFLFSFFLFIVVIICYIYKFLLFYFYQFSTSVMGSLDSARDDGTRSDIFTRKDDLSRRFFGFFKPSEWQDFGWDDVFLVVISTKWNAWRNPLRRSKATQWNPSLTGEIHCVDEIFPWKMK